MSWSWHINGTMKTVKIDHLFSSQILNHLCTQQLFQNIKVLVCGVVCTYTYMYIRTVSRSNVQWSHVWLWDIMLALGCMASDHTRNYISSWVSKQNTIDHTQPGWNCWSFITTIVNVIWQIFLNQINKLKAGIKYLYIRKLYTSISQAPWNVVTCFLIFCNSLLLFGFNIFIYVCSLFTFYCIRIMRTTYVRIKH